MAKSERSERPIEQPAVKTTIVGGRPPGPGKGVGTIPRGIEVLVKKASVDPGFKQVLLARRAEAAKEIELPLEPAEAMMLNAVPAAQLEAIIASTTVAPVSRAAFLGRAAAVMLAALGAGVGCEERRGPTAGDRADRPPATKGIQFDRPPEKLKEMQEPAPPPDKAPPATPGLQPDYPPPKPKSQTPAAAPPSPEQPMMPVAGAIPQPIPRTKPDAKGVPPEQPMISVFGATRQPIPRTTTKGIQPDRP
ncbi:MAG: hypothetical protein FJ291_25025 [Planctomycetes bacterium]|nr:hypothetical protein [Planctomycetota bacterium]